MASRLPRPEPGTPAFVAAADQYQAATDHATRRCAELMQRGATLVGRTGPWANPLFASVSPELPARRVCDHVNSLRGPTVIYTPRLNLLLCQCCIDTLHEGEARSPEPLHPCDYCATSTPRERTHVVVAQHLLLIARGRLCPRCAFVEQVHARPGSPTLPPRIPPTT